jgi:hypothetical protein
MTLISNTDINITMARLTRDQQFTASFTDFLVCLKNEYPDLNKMAFFCTTKNKSSSVHEYTLHIPKQTVLYTIDAHTNVLTGEQVEREVVMEDQDVPDDDSFRTFIDDYFGDFYLKKGEKFLSDVSVTDINIDAKCDLIAKIQVKYHKSYLPYPTKSQSPQQLKEQCAQLKLTNRELEVELQASTEVVMAQSKEIRRLKRRLNTIRVDSVLKLRETIHRMQAKIRESYEELKKADECPVCYECIKSEELMVPGCCHNICTGCFDRCDSCPICRDEY